VGEPKEISVTEYWGRVHRAAWAEARMTARSILSSALVFLIGLVATYFALSTMGGTEAAREDTVVRFIGAAVALCSFIGLYLYWITRVPAEWDGKNKARVEELEEGLKPKFELIADQSCLWPEAGGLSVSVGVQSISDVTIENVFVELVRFVEGPAIPNLPRKLLTRDGSATTFNLRPRHTEYVRFAILPHGEDAKIKYQFLENQPSDYSQPGQYKIKFKVYGDDVRPVNRFFTLRVGAEGTDTAWIGIGQ